MHTFFIIINTYFKPNQPIQNTPNLNIGVEFTRPDSTILNTFFNMYISESSQYSMQYKFSYFKKTICNIFISKDQRETFIDRFCKIQRTYWSLNKLVRRYRYRHAPLLNQADLFLNPVAETQHNVITIMQGNNRYLFTVLDLRNVIESALAYSPYRVSEPLMPKNPYNNMAFDNAILYYIYFFMKRGDFIMSTLFHQFFLCNFNLARFREENKAIVRKSHIEHYVKHGDVHELYDEAKYMLLLNKTTKNMEIHDDFPVNKLVDIMRPYIRLFNLQNFSLDISERSSAALELNMKLKRFYQFNPRFGRKFFQLQNGRPNVVLFDENHIKFEYRSYDEEKENLNVFVPRSPLPLNDHRHGRDSDTDEYSDSDSMDVGDEEEEMNELYHQPIVDIINHVVGAIEDAER